MVLTQNDAAWILANLPLSSPRVSGDADPVWMERRNDIAKKLDYIRHKRPDNVLPGISDEHVGGGGSVKKVEKSIPKLCEACSEYRAWIQLREQRINGLNLKIKELQNDALGMALRLLGEEDDTFAPETYEIMKRWRPIALKAFKDAAAGSPLP